jgi:bifunctional DNA-binding transcriptional regulator/antitoxin component of YhaV-PrlF toxin-antitoxin module
MPFEPKVKLGKVGNSYRVTIPVEMIRDLGWNAGDTLRIGLDDKNDKLVIYRQVK